MSQKKLLILNHCDADEVVDADADAADSNADDTNDIQAAADYGVPSHLLFQPDDLAVQAHVYKQVLAKS